MKKNSIKIIYILILVLMINIFYGCKKNDVVTISVHNLDERVFELGEEISFKDAFITVVYGDGHTEDIPLTGEYINASDLYNAFSSTGEKKINVYYKDNKGYIHYDEVTIVVISNQTKEEYIDELNDYKKDVVYSDEAKQLVSNIKTSYSIMIANSSKEDCLVLLDVAKKEIDNIKTKAEEDSLISLEELIEEVDVIKDQLNILINYEDSNIKSEIEALDKKITELKTDLNNEELELEIANIRLSISAMEASLSSVKSNVEKNNKLILSLTETINSYLISFVTKDELENKLDNFKEAYQTAIESALNEQLMIVEIRVKDGYVEYRYNNSNVFEKLLDVSSLIGEEIEGISVEEDGTVNVRLRNGQIVSTSTKIDNTIDATIIKEIDVEKETIVETIKEYFNLYYNINEYDYSVIKDMLGKYYDGFVEYASYTSYDETQKVNKLLDKLNHYLDNEFGLSSDSFIKIISIEKELKEIDTNLIVCKAYFATLLSNEDIDAYRKEAFTNRILTTTSVESVIGLYEEAIC